MPNTTFILSFTLLISLPLFLLFTPHNLPPKRLLSSQPNTLTDTTLFRQATRSSQFPRGNSISKPKLAFLFLTHTNLHFAPLWQKFFNSTSKEYYNIYIHGSPGKKHHGTGVFKNRFIPAKKTQRSSPTLISAARRLLATALLDDKLNYYFALVSESCIPLHSFHYTYNTLFPTESTRSSTQSLTRLPTDSTRSATESTRSPTRVSYIEVLSEEPQLWDRYVARGETVMLPEVPFTEFRVGSQFFILTRVHSLMVVKDKKLWRKFRLPCLNVDTCYPEEHYFPTLLNMKDPDNVSKVTLTRVNWTDSIDGHPHSYDLDEVSPELIKSLRVSNTTGFEYLFARKFTPECLPVLMDMADDVIFRD